MRVHFDLTSDGAEVRQVNIVHTVKFRSAEHDFVGTGSTLDDAAADLANQFTSWATAIDESLRTLRAEFDTAISNLRRDLSDLLAPI